MPLLIVGPLETPQLICSPFVCFLSNHVTRLTLFVVQYFPSWFPGAYFAGKAREFSVAIRRMHDYPFDEVVRQMVSVNTVSDVPYYMTLNDPKKAEGTAKPSFLSYHLERLYSENRETEEELDDLKGAAAVIYCAGADTVSDDTIISLLGHNDFAFFHRPGLPCPASCLL